MGLINRIRIRLALCTPSIRIARDAARIARHEAKEARKAEFEAWLDERYRSAYNDSHTIANAYNEGEPEYTYKFEAALSNGRVMYAFYKAPLVMNVVTNTSSSVYDEAFAKMNSLGLSDFDIPYDVRLHSIAKAESSPGDWELFDVKHTLESAKAYLKRLQDSDD